VSSTLDDTALVAALNRLADRLDRIEAKVGAIEDSVEVLGAFRARLPELADAAATTAQLALDETVPAGTHPVDYAMRMVDIGKKAAHPDNVAVLGRLVERDNVAMLGRLLDRAEDLALLLDLLDRLDGALQSRGLDRRAVAEKSVDLAAVLAKVATSPEADKLLAAGGPLEKEALVTVHKTTEDLVTTVRSGSQPVGLFGALSRMGDPEVQKAVGFALAFAKELGRRL